MWRECSTSSTPHSDGECCAVVQAEALARQLRDSKSSELDADVLQAFSGVTRYANEHSNSNTRGELRAWDMAKTAFQLSKLRRPGAGRDTSSSRAAAYVPFLTRHRRASHTAADAGSLLSPKGGAAHGASSHALRATRTLSTKDVERAVALAEHAREQAISRSGHEEHAAARMVRVLSSCKQVQHERMTFAWKELVRQMLGFFLVMVVFGIMTPTAHDCT